MTALHIALAACCLVFAPQATAGRPENPTVFATNQNPTISSGGTTYFCAGSGLLLSSSIAETYQWYKNGVAISGAVGQSFYATENGYYKVAVTHGEGPDGVSDELHVKQGNVWTGAAGDDNWYTPGNWSCGVAPSANDHVEVVEMGDDFPIISSASTPEIYGLTLADDAQLRVESGSTLVVTDAIDVAVTAQLVLDDDASLVQTNDVANHGNIIAHKTTTPMRRHDYTYWSSPVAEQTLHALSPATLADKYYSFSPQIGNWVAHLNGAQVMAQGTGYIVRAPQTFSPTVPATYDTQFIGTPNNGTVLAPVFVGVSDMNLLGNPYPSALDMDAFLTEPGNAALLDGTIYLWTHNSAPALIPGDNTYNYSSDDYAAYNVLGGTQTASAGNNEKPTGKLASGQAFFIKALADGQAMFSNSMRIVGENDQFFRSSSSEKHRLWLNLTNNEGAFKQILLGYIDGATDGIDRNFDGIPLNSNTFINFYSLVDNQYLTIQGRGLPFDAQHVVPIGYASTVAGSFAIGLDSFDGLFETQDVFLYDHLLGTTHDLKSQQTYAFETAVGTFNDRFELRFFDDALQTESFGSVSTAANGTQFLLKASSPMASVVVSDLSGRVVYERRDIGLGEMVIDGVRQPQTVYFIKIKLANGKTVVKKII
ncbi:Por secretion system C-terminal sorting domain-containing protein [Flavobacterium caeni]|uniref:Por secretion system C-terminal sorting domain-containing protein n=1 Tax=Flavobacterium caeni TaxID=490189 RepID=A0A1G5EBV5_9FLAO|nr:Por secretion system C-terminal sorting domain-containing protein [Flavobacterium caeni]